MTDDDFPLERIGCPEITTPARVGHAIGVKLPGSPGVIIVAMNPADALAVRDFITGQQSSAFDSLNTRQVVVAQCPWDTRP